MGNDLHLLVLQSLQYTVTNHPHFRIPPLILTLESELEGGERRLGLYLVDLRWIIVEDLQGGVSLREPVRLVVIEAEPRMVVSYPFGELATIVVVIYSC